MIIFIFTVRQDEKVHAIIPHFFCRNFSLSVHISYFLKENEENYKDYEETVPV